MTITGELANKKVDGNARDIWEEALSQPEFADVGIIYTYANMPTSDHRNGRCCDFMVYYTERAMSFGQRVAMGDRIRSYFVKHAVRLGVEGIIWNRHVTGFPGTRDLGRGPLPHPTYLGPTGVARPYHGPNPHTDHVHVQVNGAPARSWLKKEERDTMPTPEELWTWDHATAPEYARTKDNPTWKPESLLTEACQQAHAALVIGQDNAKKLDAILAAMKATDQKKS
jgi:hypothetical protein